MVRVASSVDLLNSVAIACVADDGAEEAKVLKEEVVNKGRGEYKPSH